MRYLKNSTLFTLLACLCMFTPQVEAGESPTVIEIFTYPQGSGCTPVEDEFHNADGSHKEGIEEEHPEDVSASVFETLIAENPNAIALNYFDISRYHEHDENGNDIIPENIDETLNDFIAERNYLYYKQQNFLDQHSSFTMVIDGQYKTIGTRKTVADAAIKLGRVEQNILPTKMVINGQNLEIELPETNKNKETTLTLIGYKQRPKYDNNEKIITSDLANTVSSFKTLGNWNGETRQETISISDMDADGFVLIAQDNRTGEIYAAGKVERPIDQN